MSMNRLRMTRLLVGLLVTAVIATGCSTESQSAETQDVAVVSSVAPADESTTDEDANDQSGTEDVREGGVEEAIGDVRLASVPGKGLPDGSANITPNETSFVGLEQQDLVWQEIDTGHGAITDSFVQAGVYIANTSEFDWIASADGIDWELLVDWDRPSSFAASESAWYLLTDDVESGMIDHPFGEPIGIGVEVLMSVDEGESWTELALDWSIEDVPNTEAALLGRRIVVIDDIVLVVLSTERTIDWTALAQSSDLAVEGDVVIPVDDGQNVAVRVIGPSGDETTPLTEATIGVSQETLDAMLGFGPPSVEIWRSEGAAPFERLDPPEFGLNALDVFDGRFALTGFAPAQYSEDGLSWSPGPSFDGNLNWADSGWWIGGLPKERGPNFEVALQQSLDGGSTWETVPGPEDGLIAQLSWVSSAGASTTWTEESFGPAGGQSPPTEFVQDGYTFSLVDQSELTVIDPAGETLVDSHFLWGGPPEPRIAFDLFGSLWLFDAEDPGVITSFNAEPLFAGSGTSGGRVWAGWSTNGETWFYDELDFGADSALVQVNGPTLLATAGPLAGSDLTRVARTGS